MTVWPVVLRHVRGKVPEGASKSSQCLPHDDQFAREDADEDASIRDRRAAARLFSREGHERDSAPPESARQERQLHGAVTRQAKRSRVADQREVPGQEQSAAKIAERIAATRDLRGPIFGRDVIKKTRCTTRT